jgi:cellulose synthase/poly-beta-1,6-N-acetylglucosamine synthase-like glycosyltransferase
MLRNVGYRTTALPDTLIEGMLPLKENTALSQWRRWALGHMELYFKVAPILMLKGFLRRNKDKFALGLELAVPQLAFLIILWGVGMTLSIASSIAYGTGPLIYLLITSTLFFNAISVSCIKNSTGEKTFTALKATPKYLLWKLPLYLGFFTGRERKWKKTLRG